MFSHTFRFYLSFIHHRNLNLKVVKRAVVSMKTVSLTERKEALNNKYEILFQYVNDLGETAHTF